MNWVPLIRLIVWGFKRRAFSPHLTSRFALGLFARHALCSLQYVFIFGKPSRSLSEWGKWMCSVCRCQGWLTFPSPFQGKLMWSRARAGPPPAPRSRCILGATQQWCDKCIFSIGVFVFQLEMESYTAFSAFHNRNAALFDELKVYPVQWAMIRSVRDPRAVPPPLCITRGPHCTHAE